MRAPGRNTSAEDIRMMIGARCVGSSPPGSGLSKNEKRVMPTDHDNADVATTEAQIIDIVARQREYFKSGATKSYENRIENLKKLKSAFGRYEGACHALALDRTRT